MTALRLWRHRLVCFPLSASSRCPPRPLFTHLCLFFSLLIICTFKPGTFPVYHHSSALILPPSPHLHFSHQNKLPPWWARCSPAHQQLSVSLSKWSHLVLSSVSVVISPICLFKVDTRTTNTQWITGTIYIRQLWIQSVCVCVCVSVCVSKTSGK